MIKSKVVQFGVQIQFFCKYEEDNARPIIMVISPDGRVIDIVGNFFAVADVLDRICRDIEVNSVENSVDTDN